MQSKEDNRKRIFMLIAIMLVVALIVSAISIALLYQVSMEEERERLVETAQSQARLMEAMGRFDSLYSTDYPGGPLEATLSQIRDAHMNYGSFGETGEVTMAKREGDSIIFLLRHRHFDTGLPLPVPIDSDLAEPMRRALAQSSGTMIGLDYRGETVLAAYEPIADLDMGIVVKIDLDEVQAPFINAGLIALIATIVVVILGSLLFLRITEPLMKSIIDNEERLSNFLEAATDGLFLFDKDLNFLLANSEGRRLLPSELIEEGIFGKNILDLMPSLAGTNRYEQYKKVIETGDAFYGEDVIPAPISGEVFINIRVFKVGNGLGIATTDITDRVRAEEEKRHLDIHLRQQQKLESIGTLASGVAHEINNPINGIMNYAQLIHDRLDPSEDQLREFSADIILESERIAEIVYNLLSFSRQDKQSHSPAQITDIVNNSLSLIRRILGNDQIELDLKLPDDLPKIKCRSQQIQQVLMNLLTNARDSLNERYPEYDSDKIILLSVHQFEKDGRRWLRTTVEDHGIGIPEEIRGQVFDPFFTNKERTEGTGLGLSISLGIVQEHHGELTFESEENQYTRFYLDLPVDNGWVR